MAKPAIHPAIKERLGYEPEMLDKDFLADWKSRSTQVCMPCWELKYCPYGPFVEQSPLLPPTLAEATVSINYFKECLASGLIGSHGPLNDELKASYSYLVKLYNDDPAQFARIVYQELNRERRFAGANPETDTLADVLGAGPLPPIHKYRVPAMFEDEQQAEEEWDWKADAQLVQAVDNRIQRLRAGLESGLFDHRQPLDAFRRTMFERDVAGFDPAKYPESIPDVVADTQCNVFGHICPVVYCGESITETSEVRRRGRYISFAVKMRVVRRDNHTCQQCGKHLRDDEVEFDHIIPVAKGGSTEEHNLRLTCFDCNRGKSDKVSL